MDMLFLRPSTQEEALALLTQYKQDAMIVAGGTDAVLRLTQKKTAPAVILSLDAIPERHEIAASDDTVRLASGVTYNELLASDVLRLYRGLREAVLHLASPAIRAVATPVVCCAGCLHALIRQDVFPSGKLRETLCVSYTSPHGGRRRCGGRQTAHP